MLFYVAQFFHCCEFEVPLAFSQSFIPRPSLPRTPPSALPGAYVDCADITCFISGLVAIGRRFNTASEKGDDTFR